MMPLMTPLLAAGFATSPTFGRPSPSFAWASPAAAAPPIPVSSVAASTLPRATMERAGFAGKD